MKEHGLIRTGEMVRAFLDGRKSQTRIRIKRLPIHADYGEPQWDRAWLDESWDLPCLKAPYVGGPMGETTQRHFCPFAVGDVAYIRETCKRFTGCACDGRPWKGSPFMLSPDGNPYKALMHIAGNESHVDCLDSAAACVTVPSIHMPKWAARLWYPILQIKDPERPADISEADAEAEGVWFRFSEGRRWYRDYDDSRCETSSAKASFLTLWQSLYGRTDEWMWPLVLGERIQR